MKEKRRRQAQSLQAYYDLKKEEALLNVDMLNYEKQIAIKPIMRDNDKLSYKNRGARAKKTAAINIHAIMLRLMEVNSLTSSKPEPIK